PDGTWPDEDYPSTFIPPDLFYTYTEPALFYPLEALGLYRSWRQTGQLPGRHAAPARNDGALDRLRQEGDPEADATVAAVFAGGALARANQALAQLARQRDPDPEGMPPALRDYFRRTAALPGWADAGKLALAQRWFRAHDREVGVGLLASSLPQD